MAPIARIREVSSYRYEGVKSVVELATWGVAEEAVDGFVMESRADVAEGREGASVGGRRAETNWSMMGWMFRRLT